METSQELRALVNSVKSLGNDMTLLVDDLMYQTKSPELVSKQMDFMARQLRCTADTIKQTSYELRMEKLCK